MFVNNNISLYWVYYLSICRSLQNCSIRIIIIAVHCRRWHFSNNNINFSSVLAIISTFSYWGITWWGTVSVIGLTGDDTVPTMDNTIYKLFPLLVLSCLSNLVLLIQHITICTSTIHASIRTDTPIRLPRYYFTISVITLPSCITFFIYKSAKICKTFCLLFTLIILTRTLVCDEAAISE